jgi:hypothetical protein
MYPLLLFFSARVVHVQLEDAAYETLRSTSYALKFLVLLNLEGINNVHTFSIYSSLLGPVHQSFSNVASVESGRSLDSIPILLGEWIKAAENRSDT